MTTINSASITIITIDWRVSTSLRGAIIVSAKIEIIAVSWVTWISTSWDGHIITSFYLFIITISLLRNEGMKNIYFVTEVIGARIVVITNNGRINTSFLGLAIIFGTGVIIVAIEGSIDTSIGSAFVD